MPTISKKQLEEYEQLKKDRGYSVYPGALFPFVLWCRRNINL